MSSPSRSAQVAQDMGRAKRRDGPPVRDISSPDSPGGGVFGTQQESSPNATGACIHVFLPSPLHLSFVYFVGFVRRPSGK
jgi:hypothetical protein